MALPSFPAQPPNRADSSDEIILKSQFKAAKWRLMVSHNREKHLLLKQRCLIFWALSVNDSLVVQWTCRCPGRRRAPVSGMMLFLLEIRRQGHRYFSRWGKADSLIYRMTLCWKLGKCLNTKCTLLIIMTKNCAKWFSYSVKTAFLARDPSEFVLMSDW